MLRTSYYGCPVGAAPRGLKPAARAGARYLWGMVTVLVMVCPARGSEPAPVTPPAEEETDLAGRLIRQARTGSEEDVMATIIRLMDEAAQKLELDFDAGEDTQLVQARIMERLDDAIKQAASSRRRSQTGVQVSTGDKRRRADGAKGEAAPDSATREGEEDALTGRPADPPGASADGGPGDGKLLESRRSWGHLPQREREELIQGVEERFLERYRDWIEQYYRALQEANE